MLKIGIDLCGTDAGKSGISTSVHEFLRQFSLLYPQHEYHLVGLAEDFQAYVASRFEQNPRFHFHEVPPAFASASKNIFWHLRHLPKLLSQLKLDAFFIIAGNRRGVALRDTPVVVSVPDLWNKHYRGKFGLARQLYLDWILPRLIKRAAGHATTTEFTRNDLVRFCGIPRERIAVTPLGVDHALFKPTDRESALHLIAQEIPDAKPPFLTFAARIEHPAKNHIDLIRAYEILKERQDIPHSLICPGKPWPGAEPLFEMIARSPYKDSIHLPGFVSFECIAALFQACDVAAFPSRFEGFGLPVIEALACGAPMVVSDIPVLEEVAGDAALRFTPGQPEQLAEQLGKLLADDSLRQTYRQKGLAQAAKYHWELTARLNMELIEAVATKRD